MKRGSLVAAVAEDIRAGKYGGSGERFLTIRELSGRCGISLELACVVMRMLSEERLVRLWGKHYYITTGFVSPETPLGELLKKSRRPLLGLHLHTVDTPFFSSLARELSRVAAGEGYRLLITESGDDPQREVMIMDDFIELGVCGVFTSPNLAVNLAVYSRCPLPLVSLGRDLNLPGCDTVLVDNYAAGTQVAKHLFERGCRSFAYIGMSRYLDNDQRRRGFADQLAKLGCPLMDGDIVAVDTLENGRLDFDSISGLLNSRLHNLAADCRLGIFCYHDLLAVETVRLIKHRNSVSTRKLLIPDDISIVGFDDLPIASQVTPALTTVSYRYESIARRSVSIMLDYMNNPAHVIGRYKVSSSLTARESTMG
ncbi:MAG: substrate-binding domain-containing protein [Clostridia bacterium]|nr:substrate-binding domain-containing protein [Clostridia bacterium]